MGCIVPQNPQFPIYCSSSALVRVDRGGVEAVARCWDAKLVGNIDYSLAQRVGLKHDAASRRHVDLIVGLEHEL
jgi:hypothetical protein